MKKFWTSYHGADGQCWFENQFCKSSGLIILGHPSTFHIGEINFYPNQLNKSSLHYYLLRTFQEFTDCTILIDLPTEIMVVANALETEGKIKISSTKQNQIKLLFVGSLPAPTAEIQPKKWWQFWL